MKRAKKLSLISVYDYPRNDYGAYWEIRTIPGGVADGDNPSDPRTGDDQWLWGARILPVEGGEPIDEAVGTAKDEADARAQSQQWVHEQMPRYRRAAPWHAITKGEAAQLAELFDAVRLGARMWPMEALRILYDCDNPPAPQGDLKAVARRDMVYKRWLATLVGELTVRLADGKLEPKYGTADQIRGLLRSQGYSLDEPTSIADPAPSKIAARKPGPQSGHVLGLGPLGLLLDALGWAIRLPVIAYSQTVRHNRLHQVRDAIDGGAGAGLWRIYDGTRPATCGTATTLLAELTMSDPSAGAASAGALTFSAITQDSSANATGTATWARLVDSTGTCCMDMAVGTSGSDLNLNTTGITSGDTVSISSAVLTAGNA